MATQFINKATSTVTVAGQLVNFSSNTVTAELLDSTLVTLVKTQSSDLVASGSTITYTVVITNLSLTILSNFNFSDVIPTGMSYATGTFKVNGTTQTPVITGQDLTYTLTTLPLGITTLTFVCNVA